MSILGCISYKGNILHLSVITCQVIHTVSVCTTLLKVRAKWKHMCTVMGTIQKGLHTCTLHITLLTITQYEENLQFTWNTRVQCDVWCVCVNWCEQLALKWHTLSLRGLQSSTMATRLLENNRSMIHTSPPSVCVCVCVWVHMCMCVGMVGGRECHCTSITEWVYVRLVKLAVSTHTPNCNIQSRLISTISCTTGASHQLQHSICAVYLFQSLVPVSQVMWEERVCSLSSAPLRVTCNWYSIYMYKV